MTHTDPILPTLFLSTSPSKQTFKNHACSLALHGAAAFLLLLAVRQASPIPKPDSLRAWTTYQLSNVVFAPTFSTAGGRASGGGHLEVTPASFGTPPPQAHSFLDPTTHVPDQQPILPVAMNMPDAIMRIIDTPIGNPTGQVGPPSDGTGKRGGIGEGDHGGVGDHDGPGGQIYGVGRGGVTAPRVLFDPDPEYSDAARRAKVQGIVVVECVVGADGKVRDSRIVRSLGMGLDQKALEAMAKWRFEPGRLGAQSVATRIQVEIQFHMY